MPRLTEQEQQEIIRYLEADKPLPDKFRFLLFEDKREQDRGTFVLNVHRIREKRSISQNCKRDSEFLGM